MMIDVLSPVSVWITKVIIKLFPNLLLIRWESVMLDDFHAVLSPLHSTGFGEASVLHLLPSLHNGSTSRLPFLSNTFHEIIVHCRAVRHILVSIIIVAPLIRYSVSYSLILLCLLVDYHYWICWPIQQALEVHCVVNLCFDIYSLVETKVIMPFLECLKIYMSVKLS